MTRSVWHGGRPGRHAVAMSAALVVSAAAALAAPRVTVAQAVRVTTVSAATGAEVPNALLTAVDARDTTVAVMTTALQGFRLVPVPQAGTYRFVVRRIGQRPFTSEPVVVGPRDTVALTLRLPTAPVVLSAVRVTAGASCVGGRGHEAPEVTALWDQIRTAVRLVSLQETDSAPAAEVRRYVTRLDADGRTVLAHTVLPPERGRVYLFGTAAPETLATRGYVRRTDTTTTYTVPDGQTLLSDAFARDHCFQLVAGADSAPGLVGLAFAPAPGRRVPEVAGVLWADSATAALRALTFRYVVPGGAVGAGSGEAHFDTLPDGTRILSAYVAAARVSSRAPSGPVAGWGGGEVRFDTLPGGIWALSAWRLRTPSVEIGAVATPAPPTAGRRAGPERAAAASDAATADADTGDPSVKRLPTDPPGADPPWRVDTRAGLARLAGRVRDGTVAVQVQDAAGQPVGGATVALAQQADPAGAGWVVSDGSTRVRLAHAAGTLAKTTADGSAVVAVPPGRYLIRVALPSSAGDVQPPVTAVRVTPAARAALTIAVPTLASLAARCPAPAAAPAGADTSTRTAADASATRLIYGTVVDERAWAVWAPASSSRGRGRAPPGADTAAPSVAGAHVRAVWEDGAAGRDARRSVQATTDGEGHFVLCGLPRTVTPWITAEAPNGPSASWSVALGTAPGAAASTRVALWPAATRAATRGVPAPPTDPFAAVVDRTVSGVVYDSLRHRPLPGATVQLARAGELLGVRTVVADSAGAFRIDALAPGRYVVGFDHPVLDLLHADVPLRLVEIGPGRDAVRVDLGVPGIATLRPALCGSAQTSNDSSGVLAGRVRDAADGAPVAPATILLTWSERASGTRGGRRARRRVSVPTGPGGTYLACGMPTGVPLVASAAAPRRASGEVAVEVPPRGFAVRDLALGDTVAVARGTAGLTGTVRDSAGRPVRAARAFVWGTGAAATARDDGTFALAGLPAGTHTLEVRAIGFAPRRVAVDLAPGRPATADVRLDRVATLAPEIVSSTPSLQRTGFLDRRRRASAGRFLTTADFEHRAEVSDAIRGLAGMLVVPDGRFGKEIWGRGRRPGPCRADVILDGMPLQPDDVLDQLVGPQEVIGVEVYADGAYAPLEYGGGYRTGCSVVLVWTR